MDPSQPQDFYNKSTSGTSKKSTSEERKRLYARWVAMGGKKISTFHKFLRNKIQDFQTESYPAMGGKNISTLHEFIRNNHGFGIQEFQTESYAAAGGGAVSRSSGNNDVFGVQDFSKKILLDGLKSLPSASTTTSCPSKIKPPCTSKTKSFMSTPCTPIPDEFKWTRDTSTPEEREKLLAWARAAEYATKDPDEQMRLFDWSSFVYTTIAEDPPAHVYNTYLTEWEHSTSNNTAPTDVVSLLIYQHNRRLKRAPSTASISAPCQHKRLLKWAPSTASISAPCESKRWSLQEEVTKPFDIAMKHIQREIKQNAPEISYPGRYPDLTQEHRIYTYKGELGLYECQNALWIWAKLIYCLTSSQLHKGPEYVGEKIKEKFPVESYDMIEGKPSVKELGFVTIKLSGKWIAKSIHNMLKDGIDTWAPKLPVERVIVAQSSLREETVLDYIRMLPIKYTLMSILEYSKVDATIGDPLHGLLKSFECDGFWASELLNKWFPCEEREGEVVTKGKVPFILPKKDFENAYKDIVALRSGLHEHKADWIVYMTPVRKQVYIEMCLAVAKLEGWIPSDRHKPPRTRYAGYETSMIRRNSFQVESLCVAVAKGASANLLEYDFEAVLNCVLRYTSLMYHRLDVCPFDIQMFHKEGNTFVYLLNTRAKIHRITNDYRKEIVELKKASKLILEKDEGWETGEERVLGFHLLEFTEALEESCLCVMPHILCEYLYDLCKKFNHYHSSVCKDGVVVETSTLLLYQATAVVIEKCFHLLGILPGSSLCGYSMIQLVSEFLFLGVERPIHVNARYPTRNFRFEMFCFRTLPLTPLWFKQEGELFGLISVSDKIVPSRSHFFETDVTHVPLFNHDWRNPIKHHDSRLVFLGNPDSGYSVSFSYFFEICSELYVTNKDECYQLCNHKKEIDLSSFWVRNSDGVCGELSIVAEHGKTVMYYILLKDAIDTALKVQFKTKPDTPPRLVRGYLQAYYGDEFLYKCQSETIPKRCYMALLFRAAPSYELTDGDIPLIKSFLAVPTKGSLIVKAYLQDVNSNEVIINGTSNFKPQLDGCNRGTITGLEGCSLNIEVSWDYLYRYI